jgi:hypothetical protein
MLGSKSQRGITQMALDLLFRSLSTSVKSPEQLSNPSLIASLSASDPSEAQIYSAKTYLDALNPDPSSERGRSSRAQTPMTQSRSGTPLPEVFALSNFPRRPMLPRSAISPQLPDVSHLASQVDMGSENVVVVSMYEVYNDRIFDLLSPSLAPGPGGTMTRQGGNSQKDRRRPLLFKSTEGSPDRKVVAGLKKIVCGTYVDALRILEAGLLERRVAGTGSNSVSSRSHGFFCLEVKTKIHDLRHAEETWMGNTLTIVDLAGTAPELSPSRYDHIANNISRV